jgi:hypothetical protein
MFGIPKVIKPLCPKGLNLAQVSFFLAHFTYFRRILLNPTFNRSKDKISILHVGIPKVLKPLCPFGLNLANVGLSLAQVGFFLAHVTYFRRLLPNLYKPEQSQDQSSLMFGIPKILKPLCLFFLNLALVGLSLAQVSLFFAQVTYFRRRFRKPFSNRSKAKISLPSCLAFRKYLYLYVLLGVKLAQVGLSHAEVSFFFAQVTYFRRRLVNPFFNRSKAKISLPSCLAFQK